MKLVAVGFSANSTLKGTLIAVEDSGDPIGWESSGDWSNPRFQKQAAGQLVAATRISSEKAQAIIFKALAEARRFSGFPTGERVRTEHKLPTILTSGRQPRDIEGDSWNLISSSNHSEPQFFRLGNVIVHLVKEKAGGISLQPLTLAGLRGHLKRLADFVALDGRGEKPAEVPRTMIEDMLAVESPPIPSISAVSQTPVVIPPGQILREDGYHADSGIYINTSGIEDLGVPEEPSSSDVTAARDFLLGDFLGDFPFSSESDRANALSPLLTPILRPYLQGPTPLHLVEAPSEGTGKGLYCDAMAQVATGSSAAVMTEGRNEDEWRKRLTSKLKGAPRIIVIDNLRLRLESAALSSALTASIWEDRDLGASRILSLPVNCTWLANGNNPTLSRELARRTVRIRIDARVSKPWERSGFRNDLQSGWALRHRREVLRALLTLVQAWLVCGKPRGQVHLGSFQCWADTIGGILDVAGVGGFLANREEVYKLASQEDDAWAAFLEAWWIAWQGQRVGVDQLFDLAKQQRLLTHLLGGRAEHGARIAVGKELMARRDRRQGDFAIRVAGSAHGVQLYCLEKPR